MNTVIVKINDATQTIDQISVVTKDGVPTVITATNKVNYEFHDTAIGRAPNHIITKRVKNDLHVSFEKEGQESDLIIEGFYDNTDSALLGIAEDGEYYYYIPDTGETYDYVTQLEEGAVEGQALGGQEYATIIPWWIPAAAGLGLVGLIAGNSNSSSDKTPVAPPVNKPPVATDDVAKGETGQPVIIDVVANDSDPENDLDPTTVKLIDPVTGNEVTNVVVDGEGTWSVDGSTGKVIFTPVSGFTADPTPVDYVVSDKTGEKSNQATIAVDYPVIVSITGTASLNEMAADGTPNEATYTVSISNPSTEDTVVTVTISDGSTEGSADYTAPVTQNVTIPAGQTSVDITVPIVNDNVFEGPEDFNVAVTAVTAGTATIGTNNSVTTTIYDDGTTNGTDPVDPTDPTVGDDRSTAPVAVDDLETGLVGSPVTVAVVGNDTDAEGDLDPTTVMITVSPAGSTIAADGKSVDVSGEGVWTVNPTTGDITFTPETGFTGDPTPISYTVDDLTGKTSNEATVTIDYDQPTNISVSSPARVSEEGLAGGNPDTNPDSTLDTTDSATDTDNNWIRVTDTDTDLSNSVVNFVLPTAVQNITSQGNPVDFRIDSATGNIVGEYTYTDSAGAPQVQNVLTISLNGNKEAITDGYQFGYDVVLGAPVDHILGDNTEGVLPVSFGIEVFENATATESLAKSDELLVIVEDDSPLPQPVVWNIDVQQETITINGLQTGFDETLFTRPTRAGYLIADADNVAAGSTGTTVESRNYGGTIGILSAEQDATYQAGDGNTYVDSLDEGIYWGRPAGTTPPAGYTTYENTNYQGAGQGVKFETDIDLGNFSHINFSIYGDGGTLIETNLNVDFTIDVNGNSEPISVDYLLKHNETPNGNTAEFYGLTSAEYDATFVASDFIIIPNASRVITIAGQQYKLDLELVNKDPNAAVDSDRNKTFLKAYQTKINGSYDPALDDEGTFVVNSEEGKENTYDVIGKLTPLNPLPELADNVVIAGQVAVGADAVDYTNPTGTGIVWSGTSTTGANGIAIMDTDSDMTNYEFKTDYGVFVGYANGSYKFSAAKNISEIVSPGQDDIDVFSFTYKDADGDTATSTVTLNYNEYATPQNPNSIDNLAPRGTDNNDYLLGTNQAETLNGGAGNDTLVGLSGADTLLGGEGSDTIVFDKNDVSIDGGTNLDGSQENDTLVITDTSIIASNDMNNVTNFETLDLTNNTAQTLNLNLSDVISMTDGNNQLFIKGDSVDTVNVSGMTKSGTSDQAGYDLYQDAGSIAQLYIQTDIIDNVI